MRATRRAALRGALAGLASPLAQPAAAQDSSLRIVVPFGAGSGTDNTMRVFAEAFRQATGRTVIVDAKPGGGTTIGSQEVSRAKPDGGTVLYTTGGHTTNAVLMRRLPYDPVEGFTAITLLTRAQGFGLIAAGDSRFKTMDQFLAAARAEPGKITYGSSGIGNTTHVVGELFCRSARIQLTHIPYKSTPINDALAGTIDCFFVSPSLIMQYLQAGKLRALGISSARRLPQLPDTPTFGEYGIEADIPAWSGFWGPPKLPPAIVDSLYRSLVKAAHEKSFETYTRDNGGEVVCMPPAEFQVYVASEIERYKKLLPPLGIQVD
ncbi:MAG: tripartite tricarboxylate transporter substrate binding protein [Reyranellaceae bacterium]